jgi:hypothetical protein
LRRQLILRAQCCVINADPGEIIWTTVGMGAMQFLQTTSASKPRQVNRRNEISSSELVLVNQRKWTKASESLKKLLLTEISEL